MYAVGNDGQLLTHMRVTVSYEPQAQPFIYPAPISTFDPSKQPNDLLRVYLDSTLSQPVTEFVFQPTMGVRTTSGTERWEFQATDAAGNSASRAFRVTVRKSDSLAVVHSYTLSLLAPTGDSLVQRGGRRFLALLPGLAMPSYSLRNHPENQQLIDLIFLPSDSALVTPTHVRPLPLARPVTRWTGANQRATVLHRTSISTADFSNTTTAASLQQAFDNNNVSFATPTSTGILSTNQVVAFKTADGRYGLIQVAERRRTPYSALKINVRIQKN